MAKRNPYTQISTRDVPVTQPLPGRDLDMPPNSTGGFTFRVDDWTRLRRFLILGSEGGSYYASESKLTKENADALLRCIKADGHRVVQEIVEISIAGRNAKQAPVIFALAACAGADDIGVRHAALGALTTVCRTGTMLFQFAGYVEQFRGWGRSLRDGIANWYLEPEDDRDVALQVAKYQSREGWSHRDLLRLSKPQFWHGDLISPTRDAVLRWAAGRLPEDAVYDSFLQAVDEIRKLFPGSKEDVARAVSLVEMFRLPWEVLPSEFLNEPAIWHALLPHMGLGALVRNLGRLTANKTIVPMSGVEATVVAKLTNDAAIAGSRIHPLNVLTGAVTYGTGQGLKGSLKWQPNNKVLGALDYTFGHSFANVVPANKRTLVALDVSGSMDSSRIANTFLSARAASSAMALVTLATEPHTAVMAFSAGFIPVRLHAGMSLGDVVLMTNRMPFDSTDCSLPMKWATKQGVEVDTFAIYTDSEVNRGTHAAQEIRNYRERTGIPAKLVVVGMTANRFSIADPTDAGMLDVAGFDSAAPALIADFSAGRV